MGRCKADKGSRDTNVIVWDVATISLKSTIATKRGIRSVAVSPDGSTILAVDVLSPVEDTGATLWDAKTLKLRLSLDKYSLDINQTAFSPDAKLLAVSHWDDTIHIFDVATGKRVGTLKGHRDYIRHLAFAPDGKSIASGSDDRTIKIWPLTKNEID